MLVLTFTLLAFIKPVPLSARRAAALAAAVFAISATASAAPPPKAVSATTPAPVNVFGPGGPAPAMKAAATAFTAKTGIAVNVTAGPAPQWMDAALVNADLVFSGSSNMMDAFRLRFGDVLDATTIEALYLRPSAILVRKGNPKGIAGARDLARADVSVMVVEGAGQVGLWEDVAARTGDLRLLNALRDRITIYAPNSGAALQAWRSQPELDAWLIWEHWQRVIPDLADVVAVEPDLRIFRPMEVALTMRGAANPGTMQFVAFLKSPQAQAIFEAAGWIDAP